MCAGREICTPAYRIDRRNFEYHVVEFVFSGNWKLESGGRTEELRSGALFAYGPGDAYSLEAGKGGELIKYFVTFSGPDAGKMLEDCGLSGARVRYVHQVRWIHDLFEQLLDCSGLGPDLASEIGNWLSELILLRVRSDAWSCDARQSDSLQTYSRCRSFIQENYLDVGSVDAIAKQCNVDPAYLARLWRGIRRNLERYPDRRCRSAAKPAEQVGIVRTFRDDHRGGISGFRPVAAHERVGLVKRFDALVGADGNDASEFPAVDQAFHRRIERRVSKHEARDHSLA